MPAPASTLQKIERGDPTVNIGLVFEAAVIVGVPLFVPDRSRLAPYLERVDKLALLPKSIRRPGLRCAMTSRPPVPEPASAYVWVWLPGATDPVVAGQVVAQGEVMDFHYGSSRLRCGLIAPEPPLRYANALRDAAPDAWGRRVIINRFTGASGSAADEVLLNELTYLLHSGSDRIGALDFQASPTDYVARESGTASLDTLVRAAELVEQGIPLEPALAEALQHGTAIGGARPKALISDGDRKYVAKNDTYNVVKAEYVAMRLAEIAGLDVASVKLVRAMKKDLRRFDRRKTGGWTRRAGALTLLGLDMAAHAMKDGHHPGPVHTPERNTERTVRPPGLIDDHATTALGWRYLTPPTMSAPKPARVTKRLKRC